MPAVLSRADKTNACVRWRVQSFKVSNVQEGPKGSKGEQYTLADFSYEIFTGGNASLRKGKASITSLNGKTVECLVGITTNARYGSGGIGDKLAESVKSFRVCVASAPWAAQRGSLGDAAGD